jgi:hypothetical protein
MKSLTLNLPTFAFVVVTRAALAAGAGLLLSSKLSPRQRRSVGVMLVGIGAATTAPAVWSVLRGLARFRTERAGRIERDSRLIGTTRFPRKADDELVGDEIPDDDQLN